jgi:hypothetical protein
MTNGAMIRGAEVLLIVLALAATAAAGVRVARRSPVGSPQVVSLPDWRKQLNFPRRIGPDSAPYRIVVWTDFQCPQCRVFNRELMGLRARFNDSLSVVYRFMPQIAIHPRAFDAAVAAECASVEKRLGPMGDALFAAPLLADTLDVDSLAVVAGLTDLAQWRRCRREPTARRRVLFDLDHGAALSIARLPAVQVGERLYMGSISADTLDEFVRRKARVVPVGK